MRSWQVVSATVYAWLCDCLCVQMRPFMRSYATVYAWITRSINRVIHSFSVQGGTVKFLDIQRLYDTSLSMLKQQARILTKIALLVDSFVITVSFCVAFYLRQPYLLPGRGFYDYFWFLLLILPLWLGTMYAQNLYASLRTRTVGSIFITLFKTQVFAGCLAAAVIYIVEPHGFGRLVFIWFILISFVLLITCKLAMRWLLAGFRRKGLNIRHIILVGGGYKAQQISDMIAHLLMKRIRTR